MKSKLLALRFTFLLCTAFLFLTFFDIVGVLSAPPASGKTKMVKRPYLKVRTLDKEGNGCSEEQIKLLQDSLDLASSWAKAAADLFADTDINVLRESEGAKTWLSPDGTYPTEKAFPPKFKVPFDWDPSNNQGAFNDLKKFAALRFGKVGESYNDKLIPTTMAISVVSDLEAIGDDSFLFVCIPKEPLGKGLLGNRCKDPTTFASTATDIRVMFLCYRFFARYTTSGQYASVEDTVLHDTDEYESAKGKGEPERFPRPINTASTLLHEGQHSRYLLQKEKEWVELEDVLSTKTGVPGIPENIANKEHLLPQDRSLNAENWALVAFLVNVDKQLFLEPPKTTPDQLGPSQEGVK